MIDLSKYHKVRAIIFDLDGVLVDSRNLHFEALNKSLEEINKDYVITVEEHLAKYDGLPTSKKLELLTKEKGLSSELHHIVWKRKQGKTIDLIKTMIRPSPALRALLTRLKADGYKLYCCSNSISLTLVKMLEALGIWEYFNRVYSNEDVFPFTKPHPSIYMKCCCDEGLVPCQVVVIEDSPIGRVAASLSGCHVCPVPCPSAVNLDTIMKKIATAESQNKNMSIDTRWTSDIQVVIPMAGLGSRFQVAGYQHPKPLIPIGKPGEEKPMICWVIDNLNITGAKFIFILRNEHVEMIKDTLEAHAPGCKIVTVDNVTQGPACTVLEAWEQGALDPSKPLLIANSDQWLEWDANAFLYQSQNCDGSISVFHQPDPNDTKWSYASLDIHGFVKEVREKIVISDIATTGVYYWNRTDEFVKYAGEMIRDNERVNNEFYVAPVYNRAIADGKRIKVIDCKKMWGLGVPHDLETFKREYLDA
jgi:HAD superfamily hydrolase (TIGR01509 family)